MPTLKYKIRDNLTNASVLAPTPQEAVYMITRLRKKRNYTTDGIDQLPIIEVSSSVGFWAGDAVAAFAQPIANVIDRITGSHIKGCGGCARRQNAMNNLTARRANRTQPTYSNG